MSVSPYFSSLSLYLPSVFIGIPNTSPLTLTPRPPNKTARPLNERTKPSSYGPPPGPPPVSRNSYPGQGGGGGYGGYDQGGYGPPPGPPPMPCVCPLVPQCSSLLDSECAELTGLSFPIIGGVVLVVRVDRRLTCGCIRLTFSV